MSVYVRLDQVRSVFVTSCQYKFGKFMLGLVMSVYVRIGQINSGDFRLVKGI